MRCPVDGSELRMSDREGVEIDYCPQCRGVWLDRGELDKILERSKQMPAYDPEPQKPRGDRGDRGNQGDYGKGHYPHERKESFWERIFDFD